MLATIIIVYYKKSSDMIPELEREAFDLQEVLSNEKLHCQLKCILIKELANI